MPSTNAVIIKNPNYFSSSMGITSEGQQPMKFQSKAKKLDLFSPFVGRSTIPSGFCVTHRAPSTTFTASCGCGTERVPVGSHCFCPGLVPMAQNLCLMTLRCPSNN